MALVLAGGMKDDEYLQFWLWLRVLGCEECPNDDEVPSSSSAPAVPPQR